MDATMTGASASARPLPFEKVDEAGEMRAVAAVRRIDRDARIVAVDGVVTAVGERDSPFGKAEKPVGGHARATANAINQFERRLPLPLEIQVKR